MGNQFLILLVVGALLGFGGRGVLSNLNPFKAGKVAVVKQESQKEEYYKDKIKGIEYKMTERAKGSAPTKQTLGQSIGSFVDKSIKGIISFTIILFLGSIVLGVNLFGYVRKLKNLVFSRTKALRQTVAGIQEVKGKMNGEEEKLRASLKDKHDEETELLVKQIKLGKQDEKSI